MFLKLKVHKLIFTLVFAASLIEAKSQESFDSAYYQINEIVINGNNKTKEDVILRELTFSKNKFITTLTISNRIKESENNLMNTHLFNFVSISFKEIKQHEIVINIFLQERWYFFPYPILEQADRNFAAWIYSHKWKRINMGLHLIQYNFRGRDETISVKFRKGYREQYTFLYKNIYLDNKKRNLLNFNFSLFRQREIECYLYNNRLIYLSSNNNLFINYFMSANYTYRPSFKNYHFFTFNYEYYKVTDTMMLFNEDFLNKSNTMPFFSFEYKFKRENRNLVIFPLKGSYFEFRIKQNGFNIFNNSVSYYQINLQYEYYKKVAKRHYWSSILNLRKTKNIQLPFVLNKALGYSYYLYGFENYVVNGNDFALYKTEWRYELIKPKTFYIPYIKNEKFGKTFYAFYLHSFLNVGFVNNPYSLVSNYLDNELLMSLGIGIDFFTYYDKVVRFDYSWNKYAGFNFFITLVYNNN